MDLVKDHYWPKPSVSVLRFKFNSSLRQSRESVASYLAALRQLSENCEFGATLDAVLHDRLICGMNDKQIQRRLLSEKDLTFETSLEITKGMESAQKDAVAYNKNNHKPYP